MKQEVNKLQHRLLAQLADAGGEALLSKLKPAPKPAVLLPLEKRQWVSKRKEKRSAVIKLTDAGRSWISEHPEFVPEQEQFTVAQRLFLMDLMLTGGSAVSVDFTSPPAARARKPLVEAKLLEETKGANRTVSFSLTDSGWKWAEDHLTDSYKTPGPAARVLQKALSRVQEHLANHQLRLAEFARPRKPSGGGGGSNGEPVPADRPSPHIDAAIESACLQLGGGADRQRLRLADVRRLLPRFDRQAQDKGLLDLAMAQSLVLYPMDDPREIQQEDHEAEFRTPGGDPTHIVYWIGAKAQK